MIDSATTRQRPLKYTVQSSLEIIANEGEESSTVTMRSKDPARDAWSILTRSPIISSLAYGARLCRIQKKSSVRVRFRGSSSKRKSTE